MTLDIRRVDWHPGRILDVVEHLAPRAGMRAGEHLLAAAAGRIPLDTGELESSGVVVESEDGAAVGYTAPHAGYVHGRGVALNGRDARWLEHTIEAQAGDLGDDYAHTFRSGWPAR